MMVVEMAEGSTRRDLDRVCESMAGGGRSYRLVSGRGSAYVMSADAARGEESAPFRAFPGVRSVNVTTCCHPLASREIGGESRPMELAKGLWIGDGEPLVMAGPCAVESRKQLLRTAEGVQRAGARVLRGGVQAPLAPLRLPGAGSEGIALLKEARVQPQGCLWSPRSCPPRRRSGSRRTSTFSRWAPEHAELLLLRTLGGLDRPVLLKRGMCATIEEWLQAAEYIAGGNERVILCERGIRSFDKNTRNTLDLSVVPLLKSMTHPPSSWTPATPPADGSSSPMSLAALAAGADGLVVEVHCDPAEALCDGPQSLTPDDFALLMTRASKMLRALNEEEPSWRMPVAR